MSSVSGSSSSAKIKIDPAVLEEIKKEELSRKERVQNAIEDAVPSIQEGIKSSTTSSITLGGVAGKAALNVYAPGAKSITDAVVEAGVEMLREKKEASIDPLTDSSVQKTADLANQSIGKSC